MLWPNDAAHRLAPGRCPSAWDGKNICWLCLSPQEPLHKTQRLCLISVCLVLHLREWPGEWYDQSSGGQKKLCVHYGTCCRHAKRLARTQLPQNQTIGQVLFWSHTPRDFWVGSSGSKWHHHLHKHSRRHPVWFSNQSQTVWWLGRHPVKRYVFWFFSAHRLPARPHGALSRHWRLGPKGSGGE